MSLLKTGAVQVGQSGAASNNFHWRNLLDGLLRLSRGNANTPITDVMRVRADNSVEFPGGIADPRAKTNQTANRTSGTTYTNTSGMTRVVEVGVVSSGSVSITAGVGSFPPIGNTSTGFAGDDYAAVSFEVPNGMTYKVNISAGTYTWLESSK